MDIKDILGKCDHTLLSVTATWADIKAVIDDGIKYHTASVCIPPCYVADAKKYANGRVAICTVIGFPNGYSTKEVKVFEAADAVRSGADEVDMVINIGDLKAKFYDKIQDEISAIKSVCNDKILKVIIETCLLTEEEDKDVRDSHCGECGLYQNFHGLFNCGRNARGRRDICKARRRKRQNQGGGRNFIHSGRGRFRCSRRRPTRYFAYS